MKRFLAGLLTAALVLSFVSCSVKNGGQKKNEVSKQSGLHLASSGDLMSGIAASEIDVSSVKLSGNTSVAVSDFATRLFKNSFDGQNTLISPISVLYALAMTSNGAEGDTKAQMSEVFGIDTDELNRYLLAYAQSLCSDEKANLSIANSIWFTNDKRFTVKRDFLQKNADYYGADIYGAPFDESTLRDINAWVENKTDGMIKNVLDEIPPEAVMYLINAICFDAEWQDIYTEYQIGEELFTSEDGTKTKVDMMNSEENVYLKDENAEGFIKYYSGRNYAFAALLPDEGIGLEEYISSLTGEKLNGLLSSSTLTTVYAGLPKFESEYSTEMSRVLQNLGMKDAFDQSKADFSSLGKSTAGNIFINRVIHKTFISVGERGTKAGAATVVEMCDEAAMEPIEEPKTVILDRPFVYMIIDTNANLPIFIGAVMSVE